MQAIYKRELKSYFTSMTGYVFIAFFVAIIGLFFYANNLISGNPNFGFVLYNVSFLFMLLVPILTMRIMAEEKKQKTDQLLLTSPVAPGQIVFGKYLAVLSIYVIVIAIISTFPLILARFGKVPLALSYSSILGFFLFTKKRPLVILYYIFFSRKPNCSISNHIYNYTYNLFYR